MFRPKCYAVKTVTQQIKSAESEMKRAEKLLELCKLLPDELIPGNIRVMIFGSPELEVPYDLKWFVGFEKKLEKLGWCRNPSYRDNWGKGGTSKYFTFKHKETGLHFYIKMNAKKKNSVCQLIELGEKEVVKKEKIYEIICPDGENALSGVIN